MNCSLCNRQIDPGTPAVSVVGGLFPLADPDFFMTDESVLREAYAHLDCMVDAVTKGAPTASLGHGKV